MTLLYETLLNRFRHRTFSSGSKAKIVISPEKIVPIAFNLLMRTSGYLHDRAMRLGGAKEIPGKDVTNRVVRMLLMSRRGSLYAALLTSIDYRGIFHGDQFALAVQRLGIHADLATAYTDLNFYSFGNDMREYAPFYWADALAEEFRSITEDLISPVVEALGIGRGVTTPQEVDDLIESTVRGPVSRNPHNALPSARGREAPTQWRAALRQGYSAIGGQAVQTYRRIGGVLLRSPFIALPKNQTVEGALSGFMAQIMASPQKVAQALPGAAFSKVSISAADLSIVFSRADIKQGFNRVFKMAYSAGDHTISVGRLYQGADMLGLYTRLIAVLKTTATGRGATFGAAGALFSAVVGLFALYMREGNLPGVVVSGSLRSALARKEH